MKSAQRLRNWVGALLGRVTSSVRSFLGGVRNPDSTDGDTTEAVAETPHQNGDKSRSIGSTIGNWIRLTLAYVRQVIGFYASQRSEITRFIQDTIGTRAQKREIKLSLEDGSAASSFDGSAWNVQLPDCCVVCGEDVDGDPIEEVRTVVNMQLPVWLPVCGLGTGFVFGLIYGPFWVWLGGLTAAGLIAGYKFRRENEIRLRLKRCEKHTGLQRIPYLHIHNQELVVRVGHKTVKRRFREQFDPGQETNLAKHEPLKRAVVDAAEPEGDPKWYEQPIKLADDVEGTKDIGHATPLPPQATVNDDASPIGVTEESNVDEASQHVTSSNAEPAELELPGPTPDKVGLAGDESTPQDSEDATSELAERSQGESSSYSLNEFEHDAAAQHDTTPEIAPPSQHNQQILGSVPPRMKSYSRTSPQQPQESQLQVANFELYVEPPKPESGNETVPLADVDESTSVDATTDLPTPTSNVDQTVSSDETPQVETRSWTATIANLVLFSALVYLGVLAGQNADLLGLANWLNHFEITLSGFQMTLGGVFGGAFACVCLADGNLRFLAGCFVAIIVGSFVGSSAEAWGFQSHLQTHWGLANNIAQMIAGAAVGLCLWVTVALHGSSRWVLFGAWIAVIGGVMGWRSDAWLLGQWLNDQIGLVETLQRVAVAASFGLLVIIVAILLKLRGET